MQNTTRLVLGTLLVTLLAPAALAAPGASVNADADDTLICQIAPHSVGPAGADASLVIREDCSATAHADTQNVSARCGGASTGDVVPGVHGASATLEKDCTLTLDASA